MMDQRSRSTHPGLRHETHGLCEFGDLVGLLAQCILGLGQFILCPGTARSLKPHTHKERVAPHSQIRPQDINVHCCRLATSEPCTWSRRRLSRCCKSRQSLFCLRLCFVLRSPVRLATRGRFSRNRSRTRLVVSSATCSIICSQRVRSSSFSCERRSRSTLTSDGGDGGLPWSDATPIRL